MWRGLLIFGLHLVAIWALIFALAFCYLTFATNDYRPILAGAAGFWLLGSICLGFEYWLDCKPGAGMRVFWAVCSALVWLELVRRGPAVFFGWTW
jgi:hypothetical protein